MAVFITGSTGFIGSAVTHAVLQAGHTTRLAIRRQEQEAKLRRLFTGYASQLEFVIVPDLTAPGCFDGHLQGVEYVIHLASPIPSSGTKDLLTPAVRGTVEILEAAERVPSVKRVVVTASVLSLVSLGVVPDGSVIRETNPVDYTIPPRSLDSLDPMSQYHASKLASYKATLDFVSSSSHPHFDIVTLHPVFVFGRNLVQESAADLAGTCGMLYQSLFTDKPAAGQFLGVHVDDVAIAHVRALTVTLPGGDSGRSYLLAAGRRSWAEVREFVRERYPALPVKLGGKDSQEYTVDASRAERELGIVFQGMEAQVGDVIEQQMEFL